MPPRKKPDMAFLAKMLQEYGGEGADQVMSEVKSIEDVEASIAYAVIQQTIEAEGIIMHRLHYKHGLMYKTCTNCKTTFMTNYCFEDHCSPLCRDETLRKTLFLTPEGLKALRKNMPKSFWEYEPPVVLSSETVESLYEWAKFVVENHENFMKVAQEQTQNQSQEILEEEDEEFEFHPLSEQQDEPQLVETTQEVPHIVSEELNDDPQLTPASFVLSQDDLDFDLTF